VLSLTFIGHFLIFLLVEFYFFFMNEHFLVLNLMIYKHQIAQFFKCFDYYF